MEDGFDIIQYRVKRLYNKPKSNTELLPLFWTSRLQLHTRRKLRRTCPWTSEKNAYFHTPVKGFLSVRQGKGDDPMNLVHGMITLVHY